MENTTAKIYCSGCKKYFANLASHEHHRTGDYSSRTSRTCLTSEEMVSAGYATEKKNVRIVIEGQDQYQEHDVWYSVVDRERVRAYFGKQQVEE